MARHQHQHQHDQSWHEDSPLPGIIELEAEALRDLTDTVTQWVAGLVAIPPRHLLDLGSGTGAGTFALMRRFPKGLQMINTLVSGVG